jgi:hypothetical protein
VYSVVPCSATGTKWTPDDAAESESLRRVRPESLLFINFKCDSESSPAESGRDGGFTLCAPGAACPGVTRPGQWPPGALRGVSSYLLVAAL